MARHQLSGAFGLRAGHCPLVAPSVRAFFNETQAGAEVTDKQTKLDLSTAKAEVREGVDDLTNILQKAATSLLVAHGGAMLACLSQLKDYGTNPHLKHIGFVIAAFAAGFILALLAYRARSAFSGRA
jgi:hypothetical protein